MKKLTMASLLATPPIAMIVEEFVHVVFDEVDHKEMKSSKNCAEEDEQNIILQKLESCPEK